MTGPRSYLIDVRTPAEFSTGSLYDAINIEYQLIDQLSELLAVQGRGIQKRDSITLYCRSGRRSGIALQTLRQLGYENVRDIGGFEAASEILKRERALEEIQGDHGGSVQTEMKATTPPVGGRSDARKRGFSTLLEGLKGLE